jgi:hypothetical protein
MLWPYLNLFIIVYLDNIVIYSNTVEEHRKQVHTLLEALFEAGLYLKLCKNKFNALEIRLCKVIFILEEVFLEMNCTGTIEK